MDSFEPKAEVPNLNNGPAKLCGPIRFWRIWDFQNFDFEASEVEKASATKVIDTQTLG